jgi:integrase
MAVKLRQEWRTPAGRQYFGDSPPPGSKARDWWIFVDWKGRRVSRHVGSKQAADVVRVKVEAKLILGEEPFEEKMPCVEPPPILFGDYFRTWLDMYAKLACKESTWESHGRDFRLYLEPVFGKTPLRDITREAIVQRLVHPLLTQDRVLDRECTTVARGEHRRKRLSRGTVKNAIAALRGCLSHAVENGKLQANPAGRLGRLLKDQNQIEDRKADALTAGELSKLLTVCQQYEPRYFSFLLTLARAGLRLGEAVGLRWEDIDFAGGFINVVRNISRGRETSPKSRKGRRVDMSRGLSAILESEFLQLRALKVKTEWVFRDARGGRIDSGNFRSRVWGEILSNAGLRHVRIHDLRHTFATLLIQNGESLAYVRDQLGHSSIQITVDTYGHLMPGGNRAAVDRLDALSPITEPARARTSDAHSRGASEYPEEKVPDLRDEMVAPGLEPGTSCM